MDLVAYQDIQDLSLRREIKVHLYLLSLPKYRLLFYEDIHLKFAYKNHVHPLADAQKPAFLNSNSER